MCDYILAYGEKIVMHTTEKHQFVACPGTHIHIILANFQKQLLSSYIQFLLLAFSFASLVLAYCMFNYQPHYIPKKLSENVEL